ncbi:MAG: hypothetical protein OEY01_01875 [Desulfobulbaceae bacterium]|nr:hypothetical protein [Desulfobulbaceae bacterium]
MAGSLLFNKQSGFFFYNYMLKTKKNDTGFWTEQGRDGLSQVLGESGSEMMFSG